MKTAAPLFLLFLACPPLTQAADELEFNPQTATRRSFEPIVEPDNVSLREAEKDGWVQDDELVLGVVVDGKARAYPVNTLTGPRREIINDELGGRAIAATW
jgi:hypothetical protein